MLDALTGTEAHALLDGVHAAGATTFDLAHAYGAGASERIVGEWMARRGNRDELLLITKGGHPSAERRRITAEDVRTDLESSLQRLRVEAVDLYLLHRDDESVPVERIVGFLSELVARGRVRAYGVSNWGHERVAAANAYAESEGLPKVAASSPHFSLAVPREPPWPECVSIAGPEGADARAYYRDSGVPVLAWSSLAMGYFEGANSAVGREQAMSERVFGTPENEARRQRARVLARERGSSPTEVAFLYALGHPVGAHPIVGCRTVEEYRALARAARRPLSRQEIAFLDGTTEP